MTGGLYCREQTTLKEAAISKRLHQGLTCSSVVKDPLLLAGGRERGGPLRLVVASDIPPYAVAVGNPCRVVRKRFDDEFIAYLYYT